MLSIKKVLVATALVSVSFAATAENIKTDIIAVVSQSVIDEYGREAVTERIQFQIDSANEAMRTADAHYEDLDLDITRVLRAIEVIDAPELDAIADPSTGGTLADLAVEIYQPFISYFYGESTEDFSESQKQILELRNTYGADHVIYFTNTNRDADGKAGFAFGQHVVTIAYQSIRHDSARYLVAHELGHLDDLEHDISESATTCGIMCGSVPNNPVDAIFHREEAEILASNRAEQEGEIQHFDRVFPATEMLGNVTVSGELSVEETQGNAGFILALFDTEGNPIYLDKTVSVEVYAKDIITNKDIEKIIVRVTFDAGVNEVALIDDDEIEDAEQF